MPKKSVHLPKIGLNHKFIVLCSIILLVLSLSFFNLSLYFLNLHKPLPPQQVLGETQEDPLDKELEFWKEFLKDSPGYLPGYIELFKIYKNQGDGSEAESVLEIIKKLDPNNSLL